MDEIYLSYVAGFVDGEGCLEMEKRKIKKGQNNVPVFFPKVVIVNTNKEVLMEIQKIFQGHIGTKKVYSNKHKTSYYWCVTCRLAHNFINLIYPYLRVKKQQAQLLLKFYDNKVYGVSKNIEEINRRTIMFENLKILNKKGN